MTELPVCSPCTAGLPVDVPCPKCGSVVRSTSVFTWDEVDTLRAVFPYLADVDGATLLDVADKIEAILPPRGP